MIHDQDTKFCKSFRSINASIGIKPIRLPPRVPKMDCYSERFVKSVKEECLSKRTFFGEENLRKTLAEYLIHCHEERNHQGMLFPDPKLMANKGKIKCRHRLSWVMKY